MASATVLVTGASGFIASYCVKELLDRGYQVVGTVRDVNQKSKWEHLLRLEGASERLRFVAADLMDASGWKEAVKGCDYVLHTASPFFFQTEDPERDLVQPAIQGTLNVLHACLDEPSIRRVIVTSSVAAMMGRREDGHVYSEGDWNDTITIEQNGYIYSKLRAEKALWEFVEEKKPSFEVATVLPGAVFGAPLNDYTDPKQLNTSNSFILGYIVNPSLKAGQSLLMSVDVRDVARMHIVLMEGPSESVAGQRYLAVVDARPFIEMAGLVKSIAPDFYTHTTELDETPPNVNPNCKVDGAKITRAFGFEYTSVEDSVRDTVQWLAARGWIQSSAGSSANSE